MRTPPQSIRVSRLLPQGVVWCLCAILGVPLLTAAAPQPPPPASRSAAAKKSEAVWESRFGAILPDESLLPGFREVPPDRPIVRSAVARGSLKKRLQRARDGAVLDLEVRQSFLPGALRSGAEREIAANAEVRKSAFSGLSLGDWVASSSATSRVAILAVQGGEWLVMARLDTGRPDRRASTADRLMIENAIRNVLAKPPHSPFRSEHVAYQLRGRNESGLQLLGGIPVVPVVPVLTAAGLRVTRSRDLPVVRGWRGEELVITIAAAGSEMLVRGKPARFTGNQRAYLVDGEVSAPATDLATQVGLCTYLTGPKRAFHIALPTEPRSGFAIHLAMPSTSPPR